MSWLGGSWLLCSLWPWAFVETLAVGCGLYHVGFMYLRPRVDRLHVCIWWVVVCRARCRLFVLLPRPGCGTAPEPWHDT